MSLHLGPSDASRRGATGPIGPHLGDRVSGFVDGALSGDVLDRSLVHLAGCQACRDEVEAIRLLKSRLGALPAPLAPAELISRLLALDPLAAAVEPTPDEARLARAGHAGAALVEPGSALRVVARPLTGRPQGSRPPGRGPGDSARRRTRRGVRLAALAGAALSTVVVAVVGISGPLGSDSGRINAPVTSFTSGNGTSIQPYVDVSRNTGLGPNMRPGAASPDSRP